MFQWEAAQQRTIMDIYKLDPLDLELFDYSPKGWLSNKVLNNTPFA